MSQRAVLCLLLTLPAWPVPQAWAGDQTRTLTVDGLERNYLVHFPPRCAHSRPAPVVLVFHGFTMNARLMQRFTGLDRVADREGFLTVYLNGTGSTPLTQSFNAGGVLPPFDEDLPNDVTYTAAVLDDLATIASIDERRVFATGYSNGGMMCYRLAAELSDRIAAIAAVAGTQAVEFPLPSWPVPILHFHGSEDRIVPPDGPTDTTPPFLTFLSVEETLAVWTGQDECPAQPQVSLLPNTARDGTRVVRKRYAPCADGSEVVLYWIRGGGHAWPGARLPRNPITGRTTRDISANEILWEFFERHPLP